MVAGFRCVMWDLIVERLWEKRLRVKADICHREPLGRNGALLHKRSFYNYFGSFLCAIWLGFGEFRDILC